MIVRARAALRHLFRTLLLLASTGLATPSPAQPTPPVARLDDALDAIRGELNLPGIAGVVMKDGRTIAEGAAGVRRLGGEDKIRVEDRFAIGSCTKRMTSAMIGRLVDAGKLGFESKLADVLPDMPMRDEYRAVTIAQLLNFTGGIAGYERIGPDLTPHLFDTSGTPAERDTRFIRGLLQEMPVAKPGTAARYSNASYALAAYIAAKVAGKEYTALMDEMIFRPLKLNTAGWGRPWQPTRMDQPWLHFQRPDGYVPEPDIIRPPEELFRAAGNAHMSVRDLAAFAQYELAALQDKDPLLKPATAARRNQLGPAPSGERVIHAGGAPWLHACYAVWPAKNLVAAVAVNGGSIGDAACKAFVQKLQMLYAA